MAFRNAIFVVTEERACPLYNVGEEFKVDKMNLTVPELKPFCLLMAQEVIKAVSDKKSFEKYSQDGIKKTKFECGGCEGIIRFEFKKEKEFATLQMKLLAASEKKARLRHFDQFFEVLRRMDIFDPLDEDSLHELSSQLHLQEFADNKIILKKGELATDLCIILKGKVAVVGDLGQTLGEMGPGDIFGETSLLSGELLTSSYYSRQATELAVLSGKDFKHFLNKYPILQVFFYRILVERAQASTMRAGTISSGMTGKLSEINAVELFQLINSSQKTGKVQLIFAEDSALVAFHEGELILARHKYLLGKEAFFSILAQGEGSFTYTSGLDEEERKMPVIGGFMGLIMEGMRRIDEQTN